MLGVPVTRQWVLAVAAVLGAAAAGVRAQPAIPDLSGVWMGNDGAVLSPNFEQQLGRELPLNAHGRREYMTFDHALNTGGLCLPLGPTRSLQVNLPVQIIQSPGVVAILYEVRRTFRLVYTDGREHPQIVRDYPEWMGHSVGRYEGDTLVFETVGINPRADLDNIGHEHSDQLRLVERIRRTDAKTLRWEVTVHDPVFFTEPFTIYKTLGLMENDRVMDYTCQENEKDAEHLVPGVAVGPQN